MGNTFGSLFRLTTFGESHGAAIGGVIDGCPPGVRLDLDAVQHACDRRRPGTSKLTSARREPDRVVWRSGLDGGVTLGTPIAFDVPNLDADATAYEDLRDLYRPSHADYTWDARFGVRAWAGGGRASARETVSRVIGGAVAAQVLRSIEPEVEVVAWVAAVQDLVATVDPETVSAAEVDVSPVRCPDPAASVLMEARIREVRSRGDTVGGVIGVVARGVRAGLGAPVFDKLDAALAAALVGLPACKGVEIGSGFGGTRMTGTEHNDPFYAEGGVIRTRSNRSGGVQGGISNGMPIVLQAAFKPVATVFHAQETVDAYGRGAVVRPRGRHDPCVVPRAVPIVEAMVWLVLVDHRLRWRGQVGDPPRVPRAP